MLAADDDVVATRFIAILPVLASWVTGAMSFELLP